MQLQNHFNLAKQGGELTASLCAEGSDALRIDFNAPDLPRFLSEYLYAVSPWPILISHEIRRHFAHIARHLPGLICRSISTYYENDRNGFAAQFQIPSLTYDFFSDVDKVERSSLARYDLVLSESRPRLLEANVGSNIGGWQIGWLWRQFASAINNRKGFEHLVLSHTSTVEAFLGHVHLASHEHVGKKASGNILLMLDDYYLKHGFDRELRAIFDRCAPASDKQKNLLFGIRLDDLSYDESGRPIYEGHTVDCVLSTGSPHPGHMTSLTIAHMRKLVFFPDNAVSTVLGDKTNFAAMHAMKEAKKLSEADAQLVDTYVPWSAFLTNEPIGRCGRMTSAVAMARAEKDRFVIKRGRSAQGQDVFVGRHCSVDEWNDVITSFNDSNSWLLQEFCQPDRLYAPAGSKIVEHDAIWGVFGFGGQYGGSWGRLMEPDKGRGVVNSARGAKEFVILEI